MAPRPAQFDRDIALNTFRLRNARFHSVKPPTPASGEVWEDTTRSRLAFYDGTDHRYLDHIPTDDATIAYTGGGDVDTITTAAGVKTFTYNGAGDVTQITNTDTGITTDISYNGSGDVATIAYTDTL